MKYDVIVMSHWHMQHERQLCRLMSHCTTLPSPCWLHTFRQTRHKYLNNSHNGTSRREFLTQTSIFNMAPMHSLEHHYSPFDLIFIDNNKNDAELRFVPVLNESKMNQRRVLICDARLRTRKEHIHSLIQAIEEQKQIVIISSNALHNMLYSSD